MNNIHSSLTITAGRVFCADIGLDGLGGVEVKPESTEGGRRVSILKWPEGALLNLG